MAEDLFLNQLVVGWSRNFPENDQRSFDAIAEEGNEVGLSSRTKK